MLLVWGLLRTGNFICVFVRLQQQILWVFQFLNCVFTQICCLSGALFIGKISKGHNSIKNVGGVTVLVLCASSDEGSHLYKVS